MTGRLRHLVWLWVVAACAWSFTLTAGDLPTVEHVLAIHRANQGKLSQLHVQIMHRHEATPADSIAAHKRAKNSVSMADFVEQLKTVKPDENFTIQVDGKEVKGAEAAALLSQVVESESSEIRHAKEVLATPAKGWERYQPIEIYVNGENYQVRRPVRDLETEEAMREWKFPEISLSAESLVSTYRDMGIYSRVDGSTPPAKWWHGSVGWYAYVTEKRLCDLSNIGLPPHTDFCRPGWGERNPLDGVFTESAVERRVAGTEEHEGIVLTKFDAKVPLASGSNTFLFYRAWLDLKRGGIPVKVYQNQVTDEAKLETYFDRPNPNPSQVTTVSEIRELPNGGFYPMRTVAERMEWDPNVPHFTKKEQEEASAGLRKYPVVVHRRDSWVCTAVSVKEDWPAGFFDLPFPEGQKLYDHDSGKTLGALEPKPLVKKGQQAPPLTIGRWLNGQDWKLEDLKGDVVVLTFWNLPEGPCHSGVGTFLDLQRKFDGEPVRFIGIHSAEHDQTALAAKIETYASEQGWSGIHAIDSGRMDEDSVTRNAYGIEDITPMIVVIDREGRIAYVDEQILGPDCDEENKEVLAKWEEDSIAFMRPRFESVGETWPIPEKLDPQEQMAIFKRYETKFLALQIEQALKTERKQENPAIRP